MRGAPRRRRRCDFLSRLPLLRGLERDVVAELVRSATVLALERGDVVQHEWAPPERCYITLNGAVEDVVHRRGAPLRVGFAGPGHAFGYVGLLDGQPAPVSSVTRERCLLLAIDRDHFAALLEDRRLRPLAAALDADLVGALQKAERTLSHLAAAWVAMSAHALALDAVAATSLFEDLDEREREQLAALLRPFALAPGEVLFRQGAQADRLYLPRQGRLALHARSGGTEAPLAVCGPGSALAEHALVGAAQHDATAVAVDAVSGFELDAGDFRVMRKLGQPAAHKVLRRLAAQLCRRVRETTGDVGADIEAAAPPAGVRAPARRAAADPARLAVLRRSAFFARMADEDLAPLLERMTERVLRDGEVVFAAGEQADALLVVAAGTIEVAVDGRGRASPPRDPRPRQGLRRARARRRRRAQRDLRRARRERRARAARGRARRAGRRGRGPAPRRPRSDRREPRDGGSSASTAPARGGSPTARRRGRDGRAVAGPARRPPFARAGRTRAQRARRARPALGDRRRPRAGRAVRPQADRLRRLHRVRAVAELHRGLHPARGAAAVRQHAHRVLGDGAPDDAPARRRTPPRARGRRRRRGRRRAVLRLRRDRRDRQGRPGARPAPPRAPGRALRAVGRDRARGAARRLHRSLRAPFQRARVARVDRRRAGHPRGRRRAAGSRPPARGARGARGAAAEDRQLLGGVERHRDHHRRRRGRDAAAPPRRAVVLGLRRRRAVPRHPDEPGRRRRGRSPRLQGRGLPVAAQVHRRPGNAGRARRQARAVSTTACRRSPAAGPSRS